jgi:hypothetical protein
MRVKKIYYNEKLSEWKGTICLENFNFDYFAFSIKNGHISFFARSFGQIKLHLMYEFREKNADALQEIYKNIMDYLQQQLETPPMMELNRFLLHAVEELEKINKLTVIPDLLFQYEEQIQWNHYSAKFQLGAFPFLFHFDAMNEIKQMKIDGFLDRDKKELTLKIDGEKFIKKEIKILIWNKIKKESAYRLRLLNFL